MVHVQFIVTTKDRNANDWTTKAWMCFRRRPGHLRLGQCFYHICEGSVLRDVVL